ncbi:plasmid mobilization protein [Castellaniella sp.]|uniref:plasmid mobilization protein n=1 Tax=Castellaniella sp. TaxID=1955812 RepID=UPI002AFECD98|nr:hypothetical protein [Castellaniella sp.]
MEQITTEKSQTQNAKEIEKPRKPSPPSRKKEHTRKNISVRFSDSEREKLEQAAERSGLFLTQLIRTRALKEDETIVKKMEALGDLRRSLNLIKALYKAINNTVEGKMARRELNEKLTDIDFELKVLTSMLEPKKVKKSQQNN